MLVIVLLVLVVVSSCVPGLTQKGPPQTYAKRRSTGVSRLCEKAISW